MKESKEFKEWQRDLNYLAVAYNITGHNSANDPAEVFSQIIRVAFSMPEEMEQSLGKNTLRSMEKFIKTAAGSLLELQNLLKISLNLNLISISEYHSLTGSMNEIGGIIKKFITTFNSNQLESDKKLNPEMGENALWTLN